MARLSFVSAPLLFRGGTTCYPSRPCGIRYRKRQYQRLRVPCMESFHPDIEAVPETTEDIIRDIWNKCETAKFTSWLPYFDESAVYYDTLYPQPFVGKAAIAKHLESMESAIPPSIVFVLDDIAAGSDRVGARWHAETGAGVLVPFSRGASMYSFVRKDGKLLIIEAWDFPETPVKLAAVILPLLRAASAVLRLLDYGKAPPHSPKEKE